MCRTIRSRRKQSDRHTGRTHLLETDVDIAFGQFDARESNTPRRLLIVALTSSRLVIANTSRILLKNDPPRTEPIGRRQYEGIAASARLMRHVRCALKADELIERRPSVLDGLPCRLPIDRVEQLPLYIGLIAAQAVYVYHFWVELVHLLEAAFGSEAALQALITSIGYKSNVQITALNETIIMLVVLALIDVVMISNLLIMVIVGGYETFVSHLGLEGHQDQPEWLSHVNASVLKVKLATAIIGISSIHLLKTFINAANYDEKVLMWQTIIHVAFLLSAIAIAYTDKILTSTHAGER